MFCSQCGKKVRENMLFCPFCGAEIDIPEQEEDVEYAPPEETVPEPEIDARQAREDEADVPSSAIADVPEDPPFSPEDWRANEPDWMQDLPEEANVPEPPVSPADKPVPPPRRPVLAAHEPPRVSGSAMNKDVRSSEARHYGKDSAPVSGGGLFMEDTSATRRRERKDPDDYDDYDDLDDPFDQDEDEADDAFEDDGEPGFLLRHLRSVVGLILFLILALIVFVYALSPQGQETLAKANLAWRPDVYSRLGASSYGLGQYAQAGLYYERALSRSPGNYGYASSAAQCYLDAHNNEKAAEMLKKCIAIQPDTVDPYIYLLDLYPDAVSRPLEVTQLIQQGYQRTGSERLKLEQGS